MSSGILRKISCFKNSLYGYRSHKIFRESRFYCKFAKEEISPSTRHARYFGHEEVTPNQKREKEIVVFKREKVSTRAAFSEKNSVQAVFTEVAPKYDIMNDVMSFGIHRFWKDYFIKTLGPVSGMKLLDVAGGTGDIAFRFLQAVLETNNVPSPALFVESEESNLKAGSHAVVFDMNEKMLSVCREKAKDFGLDKHLTCVQGNAENLPFEDNTFDAYTIAFGIRNVVHIDQALSEAFRVLKTGGRFLCLEFSEVKSPTFYRLYDWYSQEIIPVLGQVIAGNYRAYQYLVESIQRFPNQDEFGMMIEDAGFNLVNYENLSNGIAAIHSGYKL